MRRRDILLVWAVVAVACTNPPTDQGPPEAPTTAITTGPESTTSSVASTPVDLSARPLVWFTPQPYASIAGVFEGGSVDFFDLFPEAAEWPTAAGHVDVFKLYDQLGLGRAATDDEWQQAIQGLEERGMALAMELGPLPEDQGCGGGEGFGGDYSLGLVRRVQLLGGKVDIVVFDAPYGFAHFGDGPFPPPCHWSLEKVAAETAEFVESLREIEPDVIVGGIEPLWSGLEAGDFGEWLDAYRSATGEPLAFLHLDVDWMRHDWPEVALQVEQEARERGVPFGVIYNGGDQAGSDEAWTQVTAERFYTYEQVLGGRPDHVIIQSWHVQPSRALPDTDPTTLTGLLNRYFGDRTVVEATLAATGGGVTVEGSVLTAGGEAVAGASVAVEAIPLDGSQQVLVREGTVPEDVEMAEVGIRINTEGAGPGQADLRIYEMGYFEGGEEVNRVPDPDFGYLSQFQIEGVSIVPSNAGQGTMMQLTASPEQEVNLGSDRFPVTSGAEYRFSVTAAIPEDSGKAGYAAVVFLAGDEQERHLLPLVPAPIPLGEATTDDRGAVELSSDDLSPGRYLLRIIYPGDLRHWPASFEQEVVVG